LSGMADYRLFLVNSGAEANENALKLASFHNGRKKVVAFKKAFHGRTAGAVAVTDNPSIVAPINYKDHVTFLPFNDESTLEEGITEETAAVIVEGIQRSEEHTSELQSRENLVCRLLLEKKKKNTQ